jgi:HPt (histidine-containing phosphotransfer) domain-containing protein
MAVDDDSETEAILDPAIFEELRSLSIPSNERFLDELVGQFVHDTELRLVALRDAVETRDADAVGIIAHSITGSASQLGGRRLASSCNRLSRRATSGSPDDGQWDLDKVESNYQDLRQALAQQIAS